MARVVVVGAGTGVGKTFVATRLARSLARLTAAPVLALKPLETGVERDAVARLAPPPGSDAALLELASLHVKHPRPHPLLTFTEPISPHLAARRAGEVIELDSVVRWVESAELHCNTLHASRSWSVVETAGGVLSPLSARATNFDLARALDPSLWLLVAADSLGVLHDVSAALVALRSLGRPADLVALSAARAADRSTGANAGELIALGIVEQCHVVPRDAELADDLARAVVQRAQAMRSTGGET